MVDKKQAAMEVKSLEREYVIPLRREWMKVPRYKRTAKSVKAIKEFMVRHMNIRDGDTKKVKLDVYLNNEIWFRGVKSPPAKIKVRAFKTGDIVNVEMVDAPEFVRFVKEKHDKRHKKVEKKKVEEKKAVDKKEGLEEKIDSETEEEKEVKKEKEDEKAKSVEKAQLKIAEQAVKTEKHTIKGKDMPIHRKALKK